MKKFWLIALSLLIGCSMVKGETNNFSQSLGNTSVGPVKPTNPMPIPYITWGGDVATFQANGGLTTTPDSTYGKMGLNITLTKGDDFKQQVRDYISGKTPFLRGTMGMLGQASEVLGADPATKPVIILQISWSAGDHLVTRENIRNINDLKYTSGKKKRIAVQQGGPHVSFLYQLLNTAQLSKDDVEIVWCDDLSGPKGPAAIFTKDPTIDGCFVITPDMVGLCSGVDKVGTGAEGTVKGAHVLVSTQQMSRAIADVYAVRSDWYANNQDYVKKFVAGYLSGVEKTVALRKAFQETNKMSPDYKNLLTIAQNAFGKDVITAIETDGHGLLLDCSFVGLPGQISFFQDKGNLNDFYNQMGMVLDMANAWGYASTRRGFDPVSLDYHQIATLAGIPYVAPDLTKGRVNGESVALFPDQAQLDDKTILSFTINFEPNEKVFSADQYGAQFDRALKAASTFGNCVVVIRGHSDPTQTLVALLKSGMAKGTIKRTGDAGNYSYYLDGHPLDLKQTGQIVALIKAGSFDGGDPDPKETMQSALTLSKERADAVKAQIKLLAEKEKVQVDFDQIQPVGAGISEPVIAKPTNVAEAKQNMRVEFKIVKVPAESIKPSDFQY